MSFADSFNQLTIGTNFAIGETRFRLPLHLLRCTVPSRAGTAQRRARARTHDHSEAGCSRAGLLGVVDIALRRRIFHDTPTNSDGGAEEIRTPDLLLAKETLYQLSHGPRGGALIEHEPKKGAVSIACSARILGPEPRWAVLDSNQRPLPYQGSAL